MEKWNELEQALHDYYFDYYVSMTKEEAEKALANKEAREKEQEERGKQILEWLIDAWETPTPIEKVFKQVKADYDSDMFS